MESGQTNAAYYSSYPNYENNENEENEGEGEVFRRQCFQKFVIGICLLYTSPSPRDKRQSRMPSSA